MMEECIPVERPTPALEKLPSLLVGIMQHSRNCGVLYNLVVYKVSFYLTDWKSILWRSVSFLKF